MEYIKPGYFGKVVDADTRRGEFDCKNQVIVENKVSVDYVFFGDSITQMWELAAYFGDSGKCILNRGIGGDRTYYASKRFMADVIQLHPRACVMLMGINDSFDMEYDPWRQEEGMSFLEVLERATENYEQMLSQARKYEISVFACSVLPTDMNFTNSEEQRKDYISALNKNLEKLCKKYNHVYVNYYSHMLQEDGRSVKMDLVLEGLHPNVFGYNIMAKILKDVMRNNGYDI